MKKYIVFLKTVGRSWFLILIFIILIVAIYNPVAAIVITIITMILFVLSYIPPIISKKRFLKYLKEYYKISEKDIIQDLNKSKEKISSKMFDLAQKSNIKSGIVIFVNNEYTFYHKDIINKFIEFYKKGYNEKELLDALKKVDISTRAEIKAIKQNLIKSGKISKNINEN